MKRLVFVGVFLSLVLFLSAFALAVDESPSPELSDPSPSPSPAADNLEELLLHVGRIEGYLIFFVVVVLALFCYKFMRMFF